MSFPIEFPTEFGPLLLGRAAPNAQAFVLAHLAPLNGLTTPPGGVGSLRNPKDPLPFRLVQRVAGANDLFSDFPVVSVHTFGANTGNLADTLASRAADITHRRMLVLLDDPTTDVIMADGSIANCEYLEVKEAPRKEPYRDTSVIRYVARYELGLKLV
jgi:hypothetical protein